jgi:hypothetical protein
MRLRLVAGVCVLSGGLFVGSAGSAAIAWADTDASDGGGVQSQTAEEPDADVGPASPTVKKFPHPLQTTMQVTVKTVTTTLRSIQKFGEQYSPAKGHDATVPAPVNPVVDAEASVPAVDPSATEVDPNGVAPDVTMVASESTPPAANPLAPVSTVAGPVTKAVVTVAGVVGSVPAAVMALPTSPTPVTDAITTVQEMLTLVTDAIVPLTQLPADLYTMLSVPTVTGSTTVGGGVSTDPAGPVLARRAAQPLSVAPIVLAGGMALPADVVPPETRGDIELAGLSSELPASGIAPVAQDGIAQSGLGSFLEHAVSALFVPASLSALAAVALPGVAGLLIICSLGMRIGYRQAKALFEVRRAGMAIFAGPGPLGVVRSGSLIALHGHGVGRRPDRALRVVRPSTSGGIASGPRHLAAS